MLNIPNGLENMFIILFKHFFILLKHNYKYFPCVPETRQIIQKKRYLPLFVILSETMLFSSAELSLRSLFPLTNWYLNIRFHTTWNTYHQELNAWLDTESLHTLPNVFQTIWRRRIFLTFLSQFFSQFCYWIYTFKPWNKQWKIGPSRLTCPVPEELQAVWGATLWV